MECEQDTFLVGSSPINIESQGKSCGETQYVDDLRFPGMLHCALLLSPHPHAIIKAIDDSQALQTKGVYAVIHCFNTPQILYNSAIRFYSDVSPIDMPKTERVFDREVKFVGDRVAAVAADTEENARKAVKCIKVEYEVVPAVITLEEAVKDDCVPATPFGVDGTNLCGGWVSYGSETEQQVLDAIEQYPVVHTSTFKTPRVHHGYLEPVAHIAWYTRDGILTVWTHSQSVFSFRDVLCEILGLPQARVRVIKTVCGGAFGGKLEVMHEPVVALLSMATHRPVKIRLDRRQVFSSTRTRHEEIVELHSGFTADGSLGAQHVLAMLNTGAYAGSGPNTVGAQSGKTFVQYRAHAMYYRGAPFYTNTPIAGAMRGYGCPQLMVAREVHMDQVARKLGIDPVEFRLKNLLLEHEKNCLGEDMHNFLGAQCLKEGRQLFDWKKRREAAQQSQKKQFRIGVGVGSAIHGSGWYGVYQDMTTVTMLMNNDGSLNILTGIHDLGTGARTILAQIAGEVLHLPLDCITVVEADTGTTGVDLGAQASRSTYIGGSCVAECAKIIKQQLLEEAALMLDADPEQLALATQAVRHPQSGRQLAYDSIVDAAQKGLHGRQRQIAAVHSFQSTMGVYSASAVFVQVAVDTAEGTIRPQEVLSVHSSGRIINPALCEGQVHGGIHMGLGYALSEEMLIDPETGALKNPSFRTYHMFRADEMPAISVHFIEGDEESGPFGAKGIGEVASDGVAGAVVNAVSHALDGAVIERMPLTPAYIKTLLAAR